MFSSPATAPDHERHLPKEITVRRLYLAVVVLLLVACASGNDDRTPGAGDRDIITRNPTTERALVFALRGEAEFDGQRLTIETPHVDWFTDRPERHAGRMTVADFAADWERWGFADVPPNAALIGDQVDVVVELTDGRVADDALTFDVSQTLDGALEQGNLGTIALFVDATSDCNMARQYSGTQDYGKDHDFPDLQYADLTGCDLSGTYLPNANFSNARLNNANFTNAHLTYSTFQGADMRGANFTRANLSNAIFTGATLFDTTLRGANLTTAKVADTSFGGQTDLTDAQVHGATFKNAENMQNVVLTNVDWGSQTTCPDGTISGDHGNSCDGALRPTADEPQLTTLPSTFLVIEAYDRWFDPVPGVTVSIACLTCGTNTWTTGSDGKAALDVTTYVNQGATTFAVTLSKDRYVSQTDTKVDIIPHESRTSGYQLECASLSQQGLDCGPQQ
jgi:hypothetical protein